MIESQHKTIFDMIAKCLSYCYHQVQLRKDYAVALILHDYLDRIKESFADIVGNPKLIEEMGDDESIFRKRQEIRRKIENINATIGTIRNAFDRMHASIAYRE